MQRVWGGGKMSNSKWQLIPNVSVNNLRFGVDRDTVLKELGKPKRSFRKGMSSPNTTDEYQSCHVYYSEDDKLEAIEFFGVEITIYVDQQQLFPGTLTDAKSIFPDLEEDYGSYISKVNSVGIGAEDERIESVLVGRKNYYE